MVPKVAWTYWAGGPLPWLRLQSIATFQRHHPGWRVLLGSPDVRDVPDGVELVLDSVTSPDLPPAARSDWWRYHVLGSSGGVYFDTDVLWLRHSHPLWHGPHEAWITLDGGTDTRFHTFISIGVLAASPGSRLFLRAAALAAKAEKSSDYQSHGTNLLAREWKKLSRGAALGPIPYRGFYKGSSLHQVEALWKPGRPLGGHEYGLHWYGGSPASRPFESAKGMEDLPDCMVRDCLRL